MIQLIGEVLREAEVQIMRKNENKRPPITSKRSILHKMNSSDSEDEFSLNEMSEEELRQKCQELMQTNRNQKTQIIELEDRNINLQAKYDNEVHRLESAIEKLISEHSTQLEMLSRHINTLETQTSNSEDTTAGYQKRLKKAETDLQNVFQVLSKFSGKSINNINAVESIFNENSSTSKLEQEKHEKQMLKLQSENKKLSDFIFNFAHLDQSASEQDELHERLNKLEAENAMFKNQLEQQQSQQVEIDSLLKENEQLQESHDSEIQGVLKQQSQAFVDLKSKLKSTEKKLIKADKEIGNLQRQLQEQERQKYETSDKLSESIKGDNDFEEFRIQMKSMTNRMHEKDLKLTELETTIRELKFEQDEINDECRKLKIEKQQLLLELKQKSNQLNEDSSIQQALSIFEDIIKDQNITISQLSHRQQVLLNLIHAYDEASQDFEQSMQQISKDNNQLANENASMNRELSESKNAISEVQELSNQIQDIVPNELINQINDFDDLSPQEQIIELVTKMNDKASSTQTEELSQSTSQHSETSRELVLLGHLENAIKFIRTLSGGAKSSKSNSLLDNETQTLILTQCARIGKFIEENTYSQDFPHITSIFDPSETKNQLQLFFDFIDENEVDNTPIRELYALFNAVIETNRLLFEKNQELIHQASESAANKLQNENETLKELLNQQNAMIEDASERLNDFIEEPAQDFFSNLEIFIERYLDLNERIEASHQEIDNLKKEIQEQAKPQKEIGKDPQVPQLQTKIRQQQKLIRELQNQIQEEKDSQNKFREDASSHLDDAIASLQKAQEEQHEMEQLKAKINKLQIYKQQAAKLSNQVKKLNSQIHQLEMEKETVEAQKGRIEESNYQFLDQIDDLKRANSRLQDKNSALSSQVKELKVNNEQVLQSIKKRNEELSHRYDKRLKDMETEIYQAQNRLVELQGNIVQLKNEKTEQQITIAKMKLQERSQNIKLSQIEEQNKRKIESIENQKQAQTLALKAAFDNDYQALQDEFQDAAINLREVIEKGFDIDFEEQLSVQNLVFALSNLIDQQNDILQDALSTRRKFDIKSEASLNEIMSDLQMQNKDLSQNLSRAKQELETIIEQLELIKKENEELTTTNQIQGEWVNWSKIMYRQITMGQSPPYSPKDIKFALEEGLIASIGHRTLLRRLQLLRVQKRIFLCHEPSTLEYNDEQVNSIRPLALVLLFTRRLQTYSGRLPTTYVLASQTNDL